MRFHKGADKGAGAGTFHLLAGTACGSKWRPRQDSNPRPDGPKPSALSTELPARVSRSNRAEYWTSYPAIDISIEWVSAGVLEVAFKASARSASVKGQLGRRVELQTIDPVGGVTHRPMLPAAVNQSHRQCAIPCRRAPLCGCHEEVW